MAAIKKKEESGTAVAVKTEAAKRLPAGKKAAKAKTAKSSKTSKSAPGSRKSCSGKLALPGGGGPEDGLNPGTVIGVDRGLYKHYGIYAGGLFGGNENPLAALYDIYELFKKINYKLYSPAETLRRAKSRLGESSYNLVFNNCEHFVVWCKTGVSESHQVNQIIKSLTGRSA